MSHATLTTALSGRFFIGRLGLAIANLYTEFEGSICTRYEDIKSGA